MFKNEQVYLINKFQDQTIKMVDKEGAVVALLFINKDQLIIRGEFECASSSIECPIIKNI